MIKKQIFIWISLVFVISLMMVSCIGTSPTAYTEEPKSAERVATEEPTAQSVVTQEPTAESVATEEPTTESVVMEEPEISGLPVGEIAPDFTLPDSNGNMVNLAEELQENEQVGLVFYYSVSCGPCMEQLREIEKDRVKYEEVGVQVIAIAVQTDRRAAQSAQLSRAQFPILADSDHVVAEAYEVFDGDLSNPSVFIINKDG